MDPTLNLHEQIKLADRLLATPEGQTPSTEAMVRLAELVLELDAWLMRGGELPQQWRAVYEDA